MTTRPPGRRRPVAFAWPGVSIVLTVSSIVLLALSMVLLPVRTPHALAESAVVVERTFSVLGTPEPDGTPVHLDVSLLTTDPGVARPAIVLAHGFGGSKADSLPIGRTLARHGYAVIAYTARGFGASGGRIHLDDPAYEGQDVRRIVDFAAGRPEIERHGDDPVIGVAGASYGGGAALLAGELDPRVDAIVPAYTWNDLSQALFPQYRVGPAGTTPAQVDPVAQAGVFKQRWASLLFLSGLGTGSGGGRGADSGSTAACGRFALELCSDYQQAAASGRPSAALVDRLKASGPVGRLGRISAPTLLIQGEDDTLFPLDQADANLRGLPASTPKRMIWTTGGHDAGIDLNAVLPDLLGWFDHYLKGAPGPVGGSAGGGADQGFRYAVSQDSLVGRDTDTGRPAQQVGLADYPGLDAAPAAPTRRLAVTGAAQTVLSPPGGSPAALTNLPGTGQALAAASGVAGYQLGVLPGQSATFTSAPLTRVFTLVGSGRASLRLTSSTDRATLFVSLWDLGPDRNDRPSTAVLPGLGVAPVQVAGLTPGRPQQIEVALPSVVHQVPVGHRLQLVVSSTDQAYAGPRVGATYRVELPSQDVALPDVGGTAAPVGLRVPLALVIAVGALLFAAVAGAAVLWLRRRAVQPRSELTDVPLRVEGLVKTYNRRRFPLRRFAPRGGARPGSGRRSVGEAVRAVDGVSFGAAPGQVVGLLGPNGAGKTTVLRMLVGLIRPDAGSIWVNGQPVHAGADVLGSVGAFIEGPGFLPHLSGRQNLLGYWAATGRPLAEARLDEALGIAGLGSAVDRRVRGYSQGMRQRLGIAQAMLGLPHLLLLDEPTNGLDPPQIRAMRDVLRSYARAGRTVVVSSHLLAEVQQTCSHVVVMNRGKVILTGSMEELTAGDHVSVIGVEPGEQAQAVQVLTRAGWRTESSADRLRVTGEGTRADAVATLVGAGIAVDFVDGRQPLEDVFMTLMGSDDSSPESDRP